MTENKILVDIHEDQKIIKLLEENNIPHEVKHLEMCDYIIGNFGIERKSITDFSSSSFGHLQEQVMNMLNNKEQFSQVAIVLIGDYDDMYWLRMKTSQASFLGMLSSLTMKYKVSIIHFKRNSQFIHYLKLCLEKLEGSIDFTKLKRLESKDNTELSILCALPSISQMKAKQILEKYDIKLSFIDKETKQEVIEEQFIDKLKEFDKIGNKIANNMKRYFY